MEDIVFYAMTQTIPWGCFGRRCAWNIVSFSFLYIFDFRRKDCFRLGMKTILCPTFNCHCTWTVIFMRFGYPNLISIYWSGIMSHLIRYMIALNPLKLLFDLSSFVIHDDLWVKRAMRSWKRPLNAFRAVSSFGRCVTANVLINRWNAEGNWEILVAGLDSWLVGVRMWN